MPFGRLDRPAPAQPMSEINMTPLIDVMLVLLVIFMVTAPLMVSSLRLDLPSAAAASPGDATSTLDIAMTPDGALFLAGERLDDAAFAARLAEAAKARPDTEVQLRADQTVAYGKVAALIGQLQQAGLNRIAFVAEPDAAPR